MFYSKKKCQLLLQATYTRYLKKEATLSPEVKTKLKEALLQLETSIHQSDKKKMVEAAKSIQALKKEHLAKSTRELLVEWSLGIAVALLVAVLVRPMVFELYVVPTGSMRPTILEQDRLFVTKTAFGINVPLVPKQFYFDRSLVNRCDGVAFTGENLDIPNVDVMNFYIFPAKKQLVKRLIGKPGDVLYFYGGQIYGVDADGNDISSLLQPKYLSHITHVPFITFEGKVKTPPSSKQEIATPSLFYQYGMPVAELDAITRSMVHGKLFPQKNEDGSSRTFSHYYDMWGISNYGMVRLLTADQAKKFQANIPKNIEHTAVLEIRHHPNIYNASISMDIQGRARPHLGVFTSYLPLSTKHMQNIFTHMTTMRFIVQDGKFFQYSYEGIRKSYHRYAPSFAGVPNGTYEFENGQAYKIHSMGFRSKVPSTHPLMRFSEEKTRFFFNLGIEMFSPFEPSSPDDILRPSRYTFFNNGDLYLLGHSIVSKNDPQMAYFINREYEKQESGTKLRPYPPFEDPGPPLKNDGSVDVEKVRNNGLLVPEDHYLALGDNYEASLDCRDFGFLPQQNIRGAPSFIFWPISKRFGGFPQPPMHLFNLPRIIMWSLVLIALIAYSVTSRKKRNRPITFE